MNWFEKPEAIVSREKYSSGDGAFLYHWLYSVKVPYSLPVTIGNSITEAEKWAADRGYRPVRNWE